MPPFDSSVKRKYEKSLRINRQNSWEIENHSSYLLPRSIAQEEFKNRELKPLMPQYKLLNRRTAYAVYPERRYLPKKTQLFIACLKEKSALLHTE